MYLKLFLFFSFSLFVMNNTYGHEPNAIDCRFFNIYKQGNMNMWDSVVDSLYLQRLKPEEDKTLLIAEYGLIGYHLSQGNKDEASDVMSHFERRLEKWLERQPENATLHALNAALTGFEIGINPFVAPFVNSSHNEQIANALEYRIDESLPFIEKANSLYFRPAFVGGDKDQAKKDYEKAFAILRDQRECNWLYLYVGSWLGQIYTKMDSPHKAKDIYFELLEFAPDYQYVRDELLPQLEDGEFIDITKRLEKEYSRD